MIPFDPEKISIEIVRLKAVSIALGGSVVIIDEKHTTPQKEIHKRYEVPMSLARSFIVRHKRMMKYLKPVYTAIVRYDDRIIALERHPLGALGKLEDDGLFGKKLWNPDVQDNFDKILVPLTVYAGDRNWYFDGRYIYSFEANDVKSVVNRSQWMSKDGHFRKVHAVTIDLQEMQNKDKLEPTARTCIAFLADNGQFAISPPIWKDISDIGLTQRRKGGHVDVDDEDNSVTVEVAESVDQFDGHDALMAVNLGFALKAGNEIGRLFGYEAVEPLHLPRLMIELHTVNLPNLPKEIKATYDIGLTFTHAVAWLLGMQKRTNTLDSYLTVRSLLKYLTSKGIFRRNIFDADRVFKLGRGIKDVPQISVEELRKGDKSDRLSLSTIIEQAKMARSQIRKSLTNIGTLMNEGD
jgi:hypothetical protein